MTKARRGWIASITMALVACQVQAEPKPAVPKEDASRLPKGAARFYKYVKEPLPGELKSPSPCSVCKRMVRPARSEPSQRGWR